MVNELYYQHPCSTCGGYHNQADTAIEFSPKVIEAYLRKLYGKKFDVETEIEPTIWREVLKNLNKACAEGISQSTLPPTLEQDFYSELKLSNGVFAAFKVHSMGNIMAEKLTDENGKLKPFRQWKEEVESIASHFVGPWLQTEYNTAVIRAHNAADWLNFERNKDIFPNLRWMPTTSPDPDEIHRAFWERKVTRPINDPFWNKHRPGDRWNCKCSLEATDDPITDIPGETNKERPQPGLKENPAKTKQIFDKSHPYFPKSCKGCKFNTGFINKLTKWYWNAENKCNHCPGVLGAVKKAKTENDITAIFEKIPNLSGAEYIKNVRAITEMKIFKKVKKDIYSAVGKEDNDYKNLMAGAKKAVRAGFSVYILPNPNSVKSPDYIFKRNGVVKMYDLKTITGQGSIGSRLKESKGQTRRVFLNLATQYNSNKMASEIKKHFENNSEAIEVLIAVGNKLISVERIFTQKKDYHKQFRKMIET